MKKIMLVDDSELFYNFIKEVLKREEIEIVWARSGKEALEKYRSVRPDLVMVDIILSDMNGVDLIEKLKKEHRDAKIVVISGLDKDYVIEDALNAGALDYIVKNLPVLEFRKKVLGYLNYN